MDTAQERSPPPLLKRHVAAAVAGNALEFFDFTAYAFFAIQIGHAFFPGHSQTDTLILSLITFGVGFVGRPIGAVVLGVFGDRAGRRPAMMLSFLLMCVGVLGLAVTPSYAQIGVAAPVIVLGARMVQGFALGGEVGPTSAFLIEGAPAAKRGVYGAWQYASQNLANLVAGLFGVALAASLSGAALAAWGWRIPFLAGAAVVPLGLYLRRGVPETFRGGERAKADPVEVARGRRAVILGLPMLASTTVSYAVFNFLTTYAVAFLHMGQGVAFAATVTWGACGLVFTLVGGALSDRWGRKSLMIWPRIAFLASIFPGFLWIVSTRSGAALIIATAVMGTLASLSNGTSFVCLTEAIPKPVRSGSLAVIYALSIAVFNGTAQLFITQMIKTTGDLMWPAYYLAAATAVGIVLMAMMAETAPRKLRA